MAQLSDSRKSALAREVTAAYTWHDLFSAMSHWQKEQFPEASVESAVKHLKKEIEELANKPTDLDEWADVLHLVVQGVAKACKQIGPKAGPLPMHNLFYGTVKAKLLHNITERTWQEPVEGVYEHVRGEN